ncbi:MAG: hypothetical protein K0S80_2926 [Neobacillus sp.]|nr:hypothetical protein [Neobacillus sp.]
MGNRSSFPNTPDIFTELADCLASDKTNVERYQTLVFTENRTADQDSELENLKIILYNKIAGAEFFNKLSDSISNLQSFFLDSIVPYLSTLEVGALKALIGELSELSTDNKETLVAALNEIQSETNISSGNVSALEDKLGDLAELDTTTITSMVLAINEVLEKLNTEKANVATHETRLDTVEETLNKYNPHFYIETGVMYTVNPGELKQITISPTMLKQNKLFTLGSNEMIAQEAGIYFVDAQTNWSGMSENKIGESIIRRVKSSGSYSDFVFPFRGSQGTDGNNEGGFQTRGAILIDCAVGDKIRLFYRHYDIGVRQVKQEWIKCFKVSKM